MIPDTSHLVPWLLGALRLWVCFACLPWVRGAWWGWAAGWALAALTLGDNPAPIALTTAHVVTALLTGAALGLCARALCLAGFALGGLLHDGLPGRARAPLGVASALWFGLLLTLQGGHVALMEAAALSLRWLPLDAPTDLSRTLPATVRAVGAAWAFAAGLALPLLMAAAALEVSVGVANRVALTRAFHDTSPSGRDGLRGELIRWAAAWALVMVTARAFGPWWTQALSAWLPTP